MHDKGHYNNCKSKNVCQSYNKWAKDLNEQIEHGRSKKLKEIKMFTRT